MIDDGIHDGDLVVVRRADNVREGDMVVALVGDEVTLFGGLLDINDLAECSQTIAYEILCNVGAHARREYLE